MGIITFDIKLYGIYVQPTDPFHAYIINSYNATNLKQHDYNVIVNIVNYITLI